MSKVVSIFTCIGLMSAVVGCTQNSNEPNPDASVDGAKYRLSEQPEGVRQVIQVREDAQDGDDVVTVGRIGGGKNPWVNGLAAFTIVDNALRACSDIPGDTCKKPWDYCCETDKLPTSTALIKVVDENGNLVKADARELLNVEELSTVVVKGKAKRDDDDNLTVVASGVYVKKK